MSCFSFFLKTNFFCPGTLPFKRSKGDRKDFRRSGLSTSINCPIPSCTAFMLFKVEENSGGCLPGLEEA